MRTIIVFLAILAATCWARAVYDPVPQESHQCEVRHCAQCNRIPRHLVQQVHDKARNDHGHHDHYYRYVVDEPHPRHETMHGNHHYNVAFAVEEKAVQLRKVPRNIFSSHIAQRFIQGTVDSGEGVPVIVSDMGQRRDVVYKDDPDQPITNVKIRTEGFSRVLKPEESKAESPIQIKLTNVAPEV